MFDSQVKQLPGLSVFPSNRSDKAFAFFANNLCDSFDFYTFFCPKTTVKVIIQKIKAVLRVKALQFSGKAASWVQWFSFEYLRRRTRGNKAEVGG